jgi:hypothetical protein
MTVDLLVFPIPSSGWAILFDLCDLPVPARIIVGWQAPYGLGADGDVQAGADTVHGHGRGPPLALNAM